MHQGKDLQWETLASRRGDKNWFNCSWETFRAKVPGGWLVLVMIETHVDASPSITFYPDPNHAWDGGSWDENRTDYQIEFAR